MRIRLVRREPPPKVANLDHPYSRVGLWLVRRGQRRHPRARDRWWRRYWRVMGELSPHDRSKLAVRNILNEYDRGGLSAADTDKIIAWLQKPWPPEGKP